MVKVTLGEMSGERAGGYEFYRTGGPTGVGQTIRRTAVVTPFQLGGGTQYQTAHNAAFSMANTIYNGFSDLEKCFYRGWALRIEEYHLNQPTTYKGLTGKALAIHDIMDSLEHTHTTYLKPLGFCVCARDGNLNPVAGATLTIRSEKLGIVTYTGESDLCGCFPACSVSPKHEPYTLECGTNKLGPLTAQEVHNLRYIYTVGMQPVFFDAVFYYSGYSVIKRLQLYQFNFPALGWEGETHQIRISGEVIENDWTIGFWVGAPPDPYWNMTCGKSFFHGATGEFEVICNVKHNWIFFAHLHAPIPYYNWTETKNLKVEGIS